MKKPFVIPGGTHTDDRGSLSFVNDFNLGGFERFYTITQSPESGYRAWQGHKKESKAFYCLEGSFEIKLVQVDNWINPADALPQFSFHLDASKSEVLVVPGGYANGILAKAKDSQLLVFSQWSIDNAKGDEYRFDKNKWLK